MTYKIVTRKQWNAKPPKKALPNITPSSVTVHYDGAAKVVAKNETAEIAKVRQIQMYHMFNRTNAAGKPDTFTDIAYSYLIGPSGNIYEGRGPTHRTAANGTTQGNDKSLAVYFMLGGDQPLTQPMLEAFVQLRTTVLHNLPVLMHKHWLGANGKVRTECPGKHLEAAYKAGYLQLTKIPGKA